MTDFVFEKPFFHADIDDTGDIEVLFQTETDNSVSFYVCDLSEDPEEATAAYNLLWQTVTYGMPDPALKKDFASRFDTSRYGEHDVQVLTEAMVDLGVVSTDLLNRTVH